MDTDNILRQGIASVSWFLRFFVGGMIREMLALHTILSRVGSAWSAWWSRPALYSFGINKLCLIKMKSLKLTCKAVHR